MIKAVEVVDIVTPTLSHFDCAKQAMKKGKHVFIEKPITNTVRRSEELSNCFRKAQNVKGQVGHVERFNPAFTGGKRYIHKPNVY